MSLARELETATAEESSAGGQRLAELTAECEIPTEPTIPNATGATMDQMVAAQGEVQAYVEASTAALECLEEIVDDKDLADEERALAIAAYNNEVANQEALAERWNTQRELFISQQQ
jgi:hypothetical protein